MSHLPPAWSLDHGLMVTIGTASSEVSVYVLYAPSCCSFPEQKSFSHTNSPWALRFVFLLEFLFWHLVFLVRTDYAKCWVFKEVSLAIPVPLTDGHFTQSIHAGYFCSGPSS